MAEIALLDANIIDGFLKGVDPAASLFERHLRSRTAATSAIVEFEVWCGLRRERTRAEFRKVLRGLRGRVFPLDSAAGRLAARLYQDLRQDIGGPGDYLIAATALLRKTPIITRNTRHFAIFTRYGLRVVDETGASLPVPDAAARPRWR
jgi:predicted nucleic acid-binding protein